MRICIVLLFLFVIDGRTSSAQQQNFGTTDISNLVLRGKIAEYLDVCHDEEVPILVVEYVTDTVFFWLSGISRMSDFANNPPTNYTVIDDRILLIYDGSQGYFKLSSSDLVILRNKISKFLEQDLNSEGTDRQDNLLLNIYDPRQLVLKFYNQRLIAEEVTNRRLPRFSY